MATQDYGDHHAGLAWSGGQRIHGPDLADVPKRLKIDSFAVAQQTEKMTTAAIASDVWSVSLTDPFPDASSDHR
ncbi:hypothetical protein N8D74_03680 [Curtobacterium flaccumfaciens]|uniref:Uncharacterized protein n=1 Tax=Curtobacterium poinsettiae TaxID=159612 RepID=A0A9Q9P7U1_9MICO|nr:hypothetical protein [Curtobacterium flaccumfaciens]UXN25993.1 hypothetical protein N8D74_03680 [Curtobacterium flaccumfaciens]UYC80835.1 hypothetical protein OE229_17265 [Curtobacterium flaccumfaciens pv. poinsettiae]